MRCGPLALILVFVALTLAPLGSVAQPRLISAPDGGSCTRFVGYGGELAGFDLNGNGECDDREVRLYAGITPIALQGVLQSSEHVELCAVIASDGTLAPLLGFSPSGEYRGRFETLSDLPRDGSVLPGGLNGDGDCVDREYRSAFAPVTAVDYFAIGDSIASGHGLMDDGEECRRSPSAYPILMAQRLSERYRQVGFREQHLLACSGARAVDGIGATSLQWQVDRVLEQLTDRPTLVTVSIGANDFHWSDPRNFMHRLYMQTDSSYRSWADERAEHVGQAIAHELARLAAHQNVYVVVTEYYNPFNTDSVFFLSPYGDGCMFRDCHGRTTYGIEALNDALRSAVRQIGNPLRVTMTDGIPSQFVGHEAPSQSCGNNKPGTSETWIQYRDDPNSNSQPEIAVWFGDRIGDWNGDCFHPNARGTLEIADHVDEAARTMGF